jgi:hypothetical protein|tara:strand:- start:513 stop:650 length:138 start_codon:yes stop_codon:yes gene_type:complete
MIRKFFDFILNILFHIVFFLFCGLVLVGIFIAAIIDWLIDLWKKK